MADLSSRVTIMPFHDRWTFLIDGKGDVVFDPTWGVTSFSSPEAAERAGMAYIRSDTRQDGMDPQNLGDELVADNNDTTHHVDSVRSTL